MIVPILTCPSCGETFSHLGKRTAAPCPTRRCRTKVPVGGPATARDTDDAEVD